MLNVYNAAIRMKKNDLLTEESPFNYGYMDKQVHVVASNMNEALEKIRLQFPEWEVTFIGVMSEDAELVI